MDALARVALSVVARSGRKGITFTDLVQRTSSRLPYFPIDSHTKRTLAGILLEADEIIVEKLGPKTGTQQFTSEGLDQGEERTALGLEERQKIDPSFFEDNNSTTSSTPNTNDNDNQYNISQIDINNTNNLRFVAVFPLRRAELGLSQAADMNVSDTQYCILEAIGEAGENGLLQSELGHRFGIDPRSVFHHLRRLTASGLVEREQFYDSRTSTSTNKLWISNMRPPAGVVGTQDVSEEDAEDRRRYRQYVDLKGRIVREVMELLRGARHGTLVESEVRDRLGWGRCTGRRDKHRWERLRNVLVRSGKVRHIQAVVDRRITYCFQAVEQNPPSTSSYPDHSPNKDRYGQQSSRNRAGVAEVGCVAEVPLLRQMFDVVDAAGPDGIEHPQLHTQLGIDNKWSVAMVKQLTDEYGVRTVSEKKNKQTVLRIVGPGISPQHYAIPTIADLSSTTTTSPSNSLSTSSPSTSTSLPVSSSSFTGSDTISANTTTSETNIPTTTTTSTTSDTTSLSQQPLQTIESLQPPQPLSANASQSPAKSSPTPSQPAASWQQSPTGAPSASSQSAQPSSHTTTDLSHAMQGVTVVDSKSPVPSAKRRVITKQFAERCKMIVEEIANKEVVSMLDLRRMLDRKTGSRTDRKTVERAVGYLEGRSLVRRISVSVPLLSGGQRVVPLVMPPGVDLQSTAVQSYIATLRDKELTINPQGPVQAPEIQVEHLYDTPISQTTQTTTTTTTIIPPQSSHASSSSTHSTTTNTTNNSRNPSIPRELEQEVDIEASDSLLSATRKDNKPCHEYTVDVNDVSVTQSQQQQSSSSPSTTTLPSQQQQHKGGSIDEGIRIPSRTQMLYISVPLGYRSAKMVRVRMLHTFLWSLANAAAGHVDPLPENEDNRTDRNNYCDTLESDNGMRNTTDAGQQPAPLTNETAAEDNLTLDGQQQRAESSITKTALDIENHEQQQTGPRETEELPAIPISRVFQRMPLSLFIQIIGLFEPLPVSDPTPHMSTPLEECPESIRRVVFSKRRANAITLQQYLDVLHGLGLAVTDNTAHTITLSRYATITGSAPTARRYMFHNQQSVEQYWDDLKLYSLNLSNRERAAYGGEDSESEDGSSNADEDWHERDSGTGDDVGTQEEHKNEHNVDDSKTETNGKNDRDKSRGMETGVGLGMRDVYRRSSWREVRYYTGRQVAVLEDHYNDNPHPSLPDCIRLARTLHLPTEAVLLYLFRHRETVLQHHTLAEVKTSKYHSLFGSRSPKHHKNSSNLALSDTDMPSPAPRHRGRRYHGRRRGGDNRNNRKQRGKGTQSRRKRSLLGDVGDEYEHEGEEELDRKRNMDDDEMDEYDENELSDDDNDEQEDEEEEEEEEEGRGEWKTEEDLALLKHLAMDRNLDSEGAFVRKPIDWVTIGRAVGRSGESCRRRWYTIGKNEWCWRAVQLAVGYKQLYEEEEGCEGQVGLLVEQCWEESVHERPVAMLPGPGSLPATLPAFHSRFDSLAGHSRGYVPHPKYPTPHTTVSTRQNLVHSSIRTLLKMILLTPDVDYRPQPCYRALRNFSPDDIDAAFDALKGEGIVTRTRIRDTHRVRGYKLTNKFYDAITPREYPPRMWDDAKDAETRVMHALLSRTAPLTSSEDGNDTNGARDSTHADFSGHGIYNNKEERTMYNTDDHDNIPLIEIDEEQNNSNNALHEHRDTMKINPMLQGGHVAKLLEMASDGRLSLSPRMTGSASSDTTSTSTPSSEDMGGVGVIQHLLSTGAAGIGEDFVSGNENLALRSALSLPAWDVTVSLAQDPLTMTGGEGQQDEDMPDIDIIDNNNNIKNVINHHDAMMNTETHADTEYNNNADGNDDDEPPRKRRRITAGLHASVVGDTDSDSDVYKDADEILKDAKQPQDTALRAAVIHVLRREKGDEGTTGQHGWEIGRRMVRIHDRIEESRGDGLPEHHIMPSKVLNTGDCVHDYNNNNDQNNEEKLTKDAVDVLRSFHLISIVPVHSHRCLVSRQYDRAYRIQPYSFQQPAASSVCSHNNNKHSSQQEEEENSESNDNTITEHKDDVAMDTNKDNDNHPQHSYQQHQSSSHSSPLTLEQHQQHQHQQQQQQQQQYKRKKNKRRVVFGPYEDSVVLEPWRKMDTHINDHFVSNVRRSLLERMMRRPGIPLQQLEAETRCALSPVHLRQLLNVMEADGAVTVRRYAATHRPTLFGGQKTMEKCYFAATLE